MALVIPPGFAQVTLPFKHQTVAREAVVTFGVRLASGQTVTPTLCNQIGSAWSGAWSTFLDTDVTLGPVRASAGQDGNENLAVEGTNTYVGAASTLRAAPNTALLIRKLTARGGRRGRGRMYLPWHLAAANVTETGVIPSGGVTSAQTAADAFLVALIGLSGVDAMSILHATGGSPTGAPDDVTSLTVDPVIGTQRRRLGR